MPQLMFSSVQSRSFRPITAPAMRPSAIIQPAGEECSAGVKKPPVVQPPASVAPMPIRVPPSAPQTYSSFGARLMPNWRDISAAANAPISRVMFISDMRCISGLSSSVLIFSTSPRPIALLNQSPHSLRPPNTPQNRPLIIRPRMTITSRMAPT